jgi:hypothetical protein
MPIAMTCIRSLTRHLAAATLAALLGGCAATQAPPDDTDLRLQAASHAFGGRYEYLVVRSAGTLGDSLFRNVTGITGPSQMARDLATRMAPAENAPVRVLVTGADPAKTLQVIRDAFGFHATGGLPGLEFLFLGEPADEDEVRALVQRAGGRMRFAPFEG